MLSLKRSNYKSTKNDGFELEVAQYFYLCSRSVVVYRPAVMLLGK